MYARPRVLVVVARHAEGLSAGALAFSGLVAGDEISQLFDDSVYKLLLVPLVFTELCKHVVLATGVLHPAKKQMIMQPKAIWKVAS